MEIVKKTIGVAAAGAILVGFAGFASAAPSEQGQCRQDAHDAMTAASSEGTRGDFMSDVIFGNEPNMADGASGGPEEQEPGTQAGNVLATQSPGPFVNQGANEPPRNDRGEHGFGGADMAAAVNAACNP